MDIYSENIKYIVYIEPLFFTFVRKLSLFVNFIFIDKNYI